MQFLGENFDEPVTSGNHEEDHKEESDDIAEASPGEMCSEERIETEEAAVTESNEDQPMRSDEKQPETDEKVDENDKQLLNQTINIEKIICEDENWDNSKEEQVQAAILAAAWNAVDSNTEKLLAEVAMERVSYRSFRTFVYD